MSQLRFGTRDCLRNVQPIPGPRRCRRGPVDEQNWVFHLVANRDIPVSMTQTRTAIEETYKKPAYTSTKRASTGTDQVPVISYFTGGGFLDLGFMAQGFRIVWRNE